MEKFVELLIDFGKKYECLAIIVKITVLKIEPIGSLQKMQFEGVIKLMSQVLYFRKFCEWEND